jgi:hypothetical protein
MLISRTVEIVADHFTSEDMATDVENFFKANPTRGTERTVQQVVENIRINAAWLNRDLESIAAFLKAQH